MRQVVLVSALASIACQGDARHCMSDGDCVAGATCSSFGVCALADAGGGTGGGSASACMPACSASNECVGQTCVPRYVALTWRTPAESAVIHDTSTSVAVELTTATGRTRNDPASLELEVTTPDASVRVSALPRTDAGWFTGVTSLPALGSYTFSVGFPDAGLGPVLRHVSAN